MPAMNIVEGTVVQMDNMRVLLLLLVLSATADAGALAGAWERFPTRSNADAWTLYSFDDELFAPPLWAGPDQDDNPYAYSYFIGGDGVWFFADGLTAGGALVGDYADQKISALDVSVSIDPAEIDFIDLAVHADGPAGPGFYYSTVRLPEELGSDPDWYSLRFTFDESWFLLDDGDFVPFQPDDEFLASIQEVGIRIFPSAQATVASYVGIDDFILVPTVAPPALTTSASGGDFTLQFASNPGVDATIQSPVSGGGWEAVNGQENLTGPVVFTTPVLPGAQLFRVVTEERLTPVVSP